MSKLKTKQISFDVKAIEDDGTFSGYCSVFDVEDSYGDVVKAGAYAETIKEWAEKGKMPPVLWQHGRGDVIGVWTKLVEDEKGLYGEGRLLIKDVTKAREAHALMKHGAIDGLSIGYRVRKWSFNEEDGVLELLDIDLKEISIVTFPANEDSLVDNIKSILESGDIPSLPEFEKFLRDAGGFSKSQATAIAGHGLRSLIQGEPEAKKLANDASETLAILQRINRNV
ncbi:HK97 family phage prohead protease [Psychrobacter sp. 28M-43]|uniref:HK97 family phage prohead protease n=1 Tax=Psychrobacter sp. 28M-43 TaxID=2772254 RepID=UPI00168D98EB|nr:HK97 family phage prohead protease [Psychrobacter sp. 28M-43]QOD13520.1 HK97 family phage prohead protease [Psychrobacter sp. 28M-43]